MICELTASKLRNKIQGELRLINASECSLLPLRFYSLLLELCSQFVFPFDLLRSARVSAEAVSQRSWNPWAPGWRR